MPQVINLQNKRQSWALFPHPPKEEETQKQQEQIKEEPPQKTELIWQAPEYFYHPKSPDWYWAVGIISLGFILIAIFTENILFAIFAAVTGFTVALWGTRKPKIITLVLNGNGIIVEGRLYPYQDLISFWIHYNPPWVKEIGLVTKNALLPHLRVPFGNENPTEIRAFLLRFLPEKIQGESLVDMIARALKF